MSDRGPGPTPASADPRPGSGVDAGAGPRRKIEQFDFGVRNTLLYYRDLKATLDLSPGTGATRGSVGRLLASDHVLLSELFENDPDALKSATKRVRSISYRARRDVDKGASGTLCLAWGMATWENGRPTSPAAPIVLRQAWVTRPANGAEDFDLSASGPWSINTTLLRLLEIDFGVDVERGALGDLVEELTRHGDPEALFERVAKMAADVPGFSVSPRVVMAPIPRVAIIAEPEVVTMAYPDVVAPGAAGERAVIKPAGEPTAATVELVRNGAPDPVVPTTAVAAVASVGPSFGTSPGTSEGTSVGELPAGEPTAEEPATDGVIAEITTALRGDGWPEALIEHADSGLRVRDGDELLRRWDDALDPRPRPSRWDATHFALWGLAAAPPVGDRALDSVSRWGERRHHPVLVAWEMVAEHRYRGHRRRRGPLTALGSGRVSVPRGMDEALWGLPVDLLVEWATWVFRQWPGAPYELLLPAGTPQLVSAWYERARPVAELAVGTWVPFSSVEDELGRSAQRWVKQLTTACDGGGAPLGTWFERSMEVAAEAVALRVGATTATGAGRRARGRAAVAHAEHAI